MTERAKRRTPEQMAAEHQRKANSARARARKKINVQRMRTNAIVTSNLQKIASEGDPQSVRILTRVYAMIEDDEVRVALGLGPFANYQVRKAVFERAIIQAATEYKRLHEGGYSTEKALQTYIEASLRWEVFTGELRYSTVDERRRQMLPDVSL